MKIYKLAAISLYVKDAEENKFKDLFSIGNQIERHIYPLLTDQDKEFYRPNAIDANDDDFFSATGQMKIPKDLFMPARFNFFANEIYKFLSENKIKFNVVRGDERYLTINIISNPKASDTESFQPEINMANGNAHFIFNKVLGYNVNLWEHDGFDVSELKRRIDYYLGEEKMPEKTMESSFVKMEDLTRDFLSGIGGESRYEDDQTRNRLNQIKNLCEWAIRKGLKKIYTG